MTASDHMIYRLLAWAVLRASYGPHMDLLKTMLPRNGDRPFMDPTKANVTLLPCWPFANKTPRAFVGKYPDPFLIEALSLIVNHDPGRRISFL